MLSYLFAFDASDLLLNMLGGLAGYIGAYVALGRKN